MEKVRDERDELLSKLTEHVKEWKFQRVLVQEKRDEEKYDLENGVKWPHRRDYFVGGYSPNMGFPLFGK